MVAARPGYNGSGTSATAQTWVRARVTITGLPHTMRAGRTYHATATVAPASAKRTITSAIRRRWVHALGDACPLDDLGQRGGPGVRGRATGTWYLRAVASSVTTSGQGVSSSFELHRRALSRLRPWRR